LTRETVILSFATNADCVLAKDIPMPKLQRVLTAAFVAAWAAASPLVADAAPIILSKNFVVQSDVIPTRDGRRWNNGYRRYPHYGRGYYNNDWYPAGAFIAGAIIGGIIANDRYYGSEYYGNDYYGRRSYGHRYYGDRYYREYTRRVYHPRRSFNRQGYYTNYRAGYYDRSYSGGISCNQRSADAGIC
jgi:hypothetical protein